MRSETSAATKATDKQLVKVQTLYLDTMVPLTSVVEAHTTGDMQEALQELRQAIKVTLQLLGNANAHMSHLRRERVIGDMNKSLLSIVGDDSTFKEAAPLLFGMEFAKRGPDESHAIHHPQKQERKPPFFSRGPLQPGGFNRRYGRGGAQNSRYGERPYQTGKGQLQGSQRQR